MAATDDLMRFVIKNFETSDETRVDREVEVEVDTYDYSDRFEFDFGSDDLGF